MLISRFVHYFFRKLIFMADKPQTPYCVIPLHKPKRREYLFFLISGIAISFPFALFFEQLSSFVPVVLSIVILAPIIEELAKVFPLFYRHGETERSIVNIGILLGVGFGITELIEYVVLLNVPLIVRIPGVIFHASSAAIVAYGIAKKNPLPYYLLSVFLHFATNFFAEVSFGFGVFAQLLILIVTYLLAYRFYNRTSKEKIVV
jgi:RsiW-degrading membrane proteinase PrsW (M82 family)